MTADGWDPAQYDRFQAERRQPFNDLLAMVKARPGGRVVDLGCGTGELTPVLHTHVGAADTLGIDSSKSMLEQSTMYAGNGVHFEAGDIAEFDGSDYNVVFANASLQWVPNHDALIGRLSKTLAPDGQLAFQVPANGDHPSHAIAVEVAGEPPFIDALEGQAAGDHTRSVLAPEDYALLLDRLGFADQHVRLQVYGHRLDSTNDLVEWVRGTLLTAYRRRLPEPMYEEFVAAYRRRLLDRLGEGRPYFYPFKRTLCWGRRD